MTSPTSPLDELIERAEKVLEGTSPGPWRYSTCYGVATIESPSGDVAQCVEYLTPNNADFIARSRTLVPELVEALKRVDERNKLLREGHRDITRDMLQSNEDWSFDFDIVRAERDAFKDENAELRKRVAELEEYKTKYEGLCK